MNKKGFLGNLKLYLIFAGPITLVFFLVIVLPFISGIYYTLTDWDGISSSISFVGLTNYIEMLKDSAFWESILITLKYVFFSVLFINIIAFSLAYILTRGIFGQNIFRTFFFAPNLIGGIILGLLWNFIFSTILVYIGDSLGIEMLAKSWLGSSEMALWALVVGAIWQYSGYMMIIYIAGFMTLPNDVMEASVIDGANDFVKLKSIIVPLMIPSIVICIFLSVQRAFMVYDVNLSLTKGGPYNSTKLASMYVYEKAFVENNYGVGQSQAFFIFFVVALITVLQVFYFKKLEVEM
ncbi:MAG: sugar ABC transporter permease [Clostridiales bacterium]